MKANDTVIFDVDAQLDDFFGKEGTSERRAAEEMANTFFSEPKVSTFYRIAAALGLNVQLTPAG